MNSPNDATIRDRSRRRTAMITGASSGIGLAFAEELARDRWNLVLVARREEQLKGVAGRLSRTFSIGVEVMCADLVDPGELAGVEFRLRSTPRVDLLVNNAGFATKSPFSSIDVEREERLIRLNTVAPMRLTRAVLPGMLQRKDGAIINVASELGLRAAPSMAVYGATKAFVVSFSQALHFELQRSPIRVQALCPGLTKTEFASAAGLEERFHNAGWDPAFIVRRSLEDLEKGAVLCLPAMPRSSMRRCARRALGFAQKLTGRVASR